MKPIKQTIVSEREAQLIYSRAFEAILWGSPALAVMCQSEAGRRHGRPPVGAGSEESECWARLLADLYSGAAGGAMAQAVRNPGSGRPVPRFRLWGLR